MAEQRRPQRQRRWKKEEPKAKKGFGGLRPIEKLTIGLITMAVILFIIAKCGKEDPPPATAPTNTANPTDSTPNIRPTVSEPQTTAGLRPLYVVIDSLSFREGPHLDKKMIRKLRFGEVVYDLGKRTDFQQTFTVAVGQKRTAPWIYIMTESKQKGWVFGAGVNFYIPQNAAPGREPDSLIVVPGESIDTSTVVDTPAVQDTTATEG